MLTLSLTLTLTLTSFWEDQMLQKEIEESAEAAPSGLSLLGDYGSGDESD